MRTHVSGSLSHAAVHSEECGGGEGGRQVEEKKKKTVAIRDEFSFFRVPCRRCIKNFMIQGGRAELRQPSKKNLGVKQSFVSRSGFPDGRPFEDEFDNRLVHEGIGVVSMANNGTKHANLSEFFITFKSCTHLNNKHSIFGRGTYQSLLPFILCFLPFFLRPRWCFLCGCVDAGVFLLFCLTFVCASLLCSPAGVFSGLRRS